MKKTSLSLATALIGAALLSGCTDDPGAAQTSTAPSSRSAEATTNPSGSAAPPSSSDAGVEGTMVRLSAGAETVDVTIGEDTPATRDFVSMLPMTLTLEEFNGREKIADLPRELEWDGSPGSGPEDGDLIFFVPWGNIGFYYNTDGIGYSDQTIHLGTYDATEEELARFEGQETTVEIVE